ncbi:MAG: SPFH domain-containing protein [Eubacteriaceae bacterium]|nr:SPFH domain-containing protein [Eubacteriaceae bacterium]
MGLIRAAASAFGGAMADQWLEVIEPDEMDQDVVFTQGVLVSNKRSSNTKGTSGIVTDGSIVHVYENQFMLLVDGGKVVDYSADPGYFTIDNKSAPSMFNGNFKDSLKEAWGRIRFGGVPSNKLQVFYINLQEIKGIKFGTRNPINYYDNFYQAELFVRAHGTYSIRIENPLKFYSEVISKSASRVKISEINDQYLDEFLDALQSSINGLSIEGERISFLASKSRELSKYMANTLDDDWTQNRGFEVVSVGIASISYDETSQKLINMRNEGAMLSDPTIREGFVQGSIARGFEKAGENTGGQGGFIGMNLANNSASSFAGSFSESNRQQAAQNTQSSAPAPTGATWTCSCGSVNPDSAKFCPSCGLPRPAAAAKLFCAECGSEIAPDAKFCPNCGNKL